MVLTEDACISYVKPYYIVNHTGEQLQFGLKTEDEEPIYDDERYLVKDFRNYHFKLLGIFILSIILFFMALKLFENVSENLGVIHMAAFGSAIVLLNIIAHDLLGGIGIEYYYPDVLAYKIAAFTISLIILYKILEYRNKSVNFFELRMWGSLTVIAVFAYFLSFGIFGIFGILTDKLTLNLNITNINVTGLMLTVLLLALILSIYIYKCINDSKYKYRDEFRLFLLLISFVSILSILSFQPYEYSASKGSICLNFLIYLVSIVFSGILVADHEFLTKCNPFSISKGQEQSRSEPVENLPADDTVNK